MDKKGYKQASLTMPILEIKAESNNMVEGYFSAFNNIDSDSDRILQGAFTKSINEHGPLSNTNRKIAHLAFHDVTRPIGVIQELKEDSVGLYFRSQLGEHTEGKDFYQMYKSGIIREHSIGFNYVPDKIKQSTFDAKTVWDIQEVKLWEGSAVVFGANDLTPNLSIMKSQEDVNKYLEKLNERMEICIKAIVDNKLSEKFNNLFHIELESLKNGYNSLVNFEPSIKDTLIIEEPKPNNRKKLLY